MTLVRFTSTIEIRNGNPYIIVSPSRAKAIKPGWRKPLPVLVRVNGKPKPPWRINMMPTGDGGFYLYLHGEIREASSTKVGDRVRVEIGFDTKYKNGPTHPMPSWFEAALRKKRTAKENWEALTPSRKKEVLRYFARLKSSGARKRNLEKALHVLSGNNGRFMAQTWSSGKANE